MMIAINHNYLSLMCLLSFINGEFAILLMKINHKIEDVLQLTSPILKMDLLGNYELDNIPIN